MINKIKKIPKPVLASTIFLICSFMQKGISMLTTPIFTRLLTTEEYGMYSVFISWTSIFTIIVTLKMSSGFLQQALVKYNDDKKNLLISLHSLSIFLVCIFCIVIFLIEKLLKNIFDLSPFMIIMMMISIFATNIFEIWAQSERTNYEYKKVAIITLLMIFFKPFLGILGILMFPSMKVKARIASLVIVEVLLYGWILFKEIVEYIKNIKTINIFKYWKYALLFCIPLIPHYLSQQILSQTDRLMINSICGSSQAGIYSLAYQIALVFTMFNSAMSSSLNPWIYKKIKGEELERINPVVLTLFRLLILFNLILIIFAPEILKFFAPQSYYEAVWAIPAITMSCVFMFLYGIFVCFEFYYEKKSYIVYASAIGAVINVVLNALLIPKFGYLVASYTTLLCYIIFCFMHYYFMIKICKDNNIINNVFEIKKIIIESIIFIASGLAMMAIYNYMLIRIFVAFGLITLVILNKDKIIETIKKIMVKK